jgi:dihydroorotate dehydrogenase (NAD+) catalytic subunit
MGGIMTGEDAAEFLIAGARAVQVGTANLSDPFALPKIMTQFENYLTEMQINDINSLVGALKI